MEDIDDALLWTEHDVNDKTDSDLWREYHVSGKEIEWQTQTSPSNYRPPSGNSADSGMGEEETQEPKSLLPANWPKIEDLGKKKSCMMSECVHPCVAKATSHLELLQTLLEDWHLREETESSFDEETVDKTTIPSRSTKRTTTSSSISDKTEMVTSSGTTTQSELKIEGTSALQVTPPSTGIEGPDIITEVTNLLARLECDRQSNELKLKQQRNIVRWLLGQIDILAEKRLETLPIAVQEEHEACTIDIAELNWHCTYRNRAKQKVHQRVEVSMNLNKEFKKDISFIEKHVPLIADKLELELEAMERIRRAQVDTNEELDKTLKRCAEVQAKSDDAHKKAEEERKHMKEDLENVNNELIAITKELAEAKMTFNQYTHNCHDYRQHLRENSQEQSILEVKEENVRTSEEMLSTKIAQLQKEIVDEQFKHKHFEDEALFQKQQLDKVVSSNKDREREILLEVSYKESQLKKLTRMQNDLILEVEDLTKKIKDCVKQKQIDEKTLLRVDQEQARVEERIIDAREDMEKVQVIHAAIKDKLQLEEENASRLEDQLRSTAEQLSKAVKEEIHSRNVLESKTAAEGVELENDKVEKQEKKSKTKKKVLQVKEAVQKIVEKVETLRKEYQKRVERVAKLESSLEELRQLLKTAEDKHKNRLDELDPSIQRLKKETLDQEKRIDHMEWKSTMIIKKFEEYDNAEKMMNKSLKRTLTSNENLEEELTELNKKIDDAKGMEELMNNDLKSILDREFEQAHEHKVKMKKRRSDLDVLFKDMELAKILNAKLASEYRTLQNKHLHSKNKLMNVYDKRTERENILKDLQQLGKLQKRMRLSLERYYKLRGRYNEDTLRDIDEKSKKNAVRVGQLQDDIGGVLLQMEAFVKNDVLPVVFRQRVAVADN
ncbi:DgyrCDS10865 [Dimorphilus gyrociliatus]|uniref:DgyrCDS10865 n=1 Tax=Dimorphilus gyrociliatus TaxID=2664684 RepID=A0A7I8W2N4_9ANNE|nr:DgyrCDS10865 [Dimorphilus gyrociliatus]